MVECRLSIAMHNHESHAAGFARMKCRFAFQYQHGAGPTHGGAAGFDGGVHGIVAHSSKPAVSALPDNFSHNDRTPMFLWDVV